MPGDGPRQWLWRQTYAAERRVRVDEAATHHDAKMGLGGAGCEGEEIAGLHFSGCGPETCPAREAFDVRRGDLFQAIGGDGRRFDPTGREGREDQSHAVQPGLRVATVEPEGRPNQ